MSSQDYFPRQLMDALPQGVVAINREGEAVYANSAAVCILGWSPAEPPKPGGIDAFTAAIQENGLPFPREEHPLWRALEERAAVREAVMGVQVQGGARWLRVSATPMDGLMEGGALLSLEDITHSRLEQARLEGSEERLKLFVEFAPAAIAMMDTEMRYIAASRRYYRDYGIKETDITGRTHYEIFPEIPERWKEIHRRCLTGAVEKAEDDPFPRADGRLDWVHWEIHPWYKSPNEIGGILLFSEVVTGHKEAELAVEAAHRQQAEILESISDAFYALDQSGCFTYVNHKACRLWNKRLDDLLGRNIWEVFPFGKETPSYRYIQAALEKRQPAQFESFSDYLEQWLEVHVYPTAHGASVYFQDITERKRTEQQILQLTRLNATLSQVNQAIVRAESVDELFASVCRVAVEYGQFSSAWIARYDPFDGKVRLAVSSVPLKEKVIDSRAAPFAESIVGQALRSGRLAISADTNEDPAMRYWKAQESGNRSMAIIPLKQNGQVCAILGLLSKEKGFFRAEQEQVLLEEIGLDLSFALEGIETQRIKRQWADAFENCAQGMGISLPEGNRALTCNPTLARMLGYSIEEIAGLPVQSLYPPEERARIGALMSQVDIQGRVQFETLLLRKDGSTFPAQIDVVSVKNAQGKVLYRVVTQQDISQRRLAEDQLRESEARYRLLAENVQDVIWVLDLQSGNFRYCSPSVEQLRGYSVEEVLAQDMASALTPPSAEYLGRILPGRVAAHLQGETCAYVDEIEQPCLDGSSVWTETTTRFVTNPENGHIEVYGVSRNIAERRASQVEIARLVERFDLAARAAHLGVWDWDLCEDLLVWDDQMYALYGVRREDFQVAYEAWLQGVYPADRDASNEISRRARAGEIEYEAEFRVVWPDGSLHWLKAFGDVIRNEAGQAVRMIGVNFDISAQKAADDQIRRQSARLRVLSEASRSFSQVVADHQAVLKTVADFLAESLGDTCHIRLVSEDGQRLEMAAAAYRHAEVTPAIRAGLEKIVMRVDDPGLGSRVFRRGEGEMIAVIPREEVKDVAAPQLRPVFEQFRPHSMIVVPLHAQERTIGVLSMTRYRPGEPSFDAEDFSLAMELAERASLAVTSAGLFRQLQAELAARQAAEEALQSERDSLARRVEGRTVELTLANADLRRASRAKDEFLSTMSHELRTPLNGILNISESLQEGTYGALEPQQVRVLSTLRESGELLLNLINDILDVSKAESGRMDLQAEPVILRDLIDSSLRLIHPQALKKHLRIVTVLDSNLGTLIADGRRLKQMLVNLLSNAVKFTPPNGRVGLEVARENEGESIRFTVWDTGIGIPKQKLDQLFQPFVQLDSTLSREYTGTGLGLALVRRLAELHGGSVGVESEEGKGSRFWFALPVPQGVESEVAAQPDVGDRQVVTAPRRALVIEDSALAADHLARYLREMNTEVVIQSHGENVVQVALEEQPDVILLDILLPDTNGWQVLASLKANPRTRAIPVVIVSVVDERKRGLEMGAVDYLLKPVTRDQLRLAIIKAIAPGDLANRVLLVRPDREAAAPERAESALILFAEDNLTNYTTYADFLESRGFRVIPALNGYEAIERAQEFKPDLILMDIQMPAMDGLESTRRLRAMNEFAQVPIIALTALTMPGDKERCLQAGVNQYLAKPLSLKQLVQEIQRQLGG